MYAQRGSVSRFDRTEGAMGEFRIERFLELSGAIKIDDLDWEAARAAGITPAEARIH